MSDPLIKAMAKALTDTQRALESERARNEQLCARLHFADQRETQYHDLVREQKEFIDLLEGHSLQEVSDVA